MFDIHKIKPVHGWREFIGEVGIIVLGVLIALTLEQVVEIIHWREKVSETTETLRQSAWNQALAAIEQQVVAPCVDQQLEGLEKRLFAPGPYRPVRRYPDPTLTSFVVRMPSRPWQDSVWSTVIGEGVSTHYNPDFRGEMDRFYSAVALNRDIARQIDQLSARLNALSLPITRDPVVVAQFARDIEEFRSKEAYMTTVSGQLLGFVEQAKMMPPSALVRVASYERSGTVAFCRANHLRINKPHAIDTRVNYRPR